MNTAAIGALAHARQRRGEGIISFLSLRRSELRDRLVIVIVINRKLSERTPNVRGFPVREEGQVAWLESPNGLDASASVPAISTRCQQRNIRSRPTFVGVRIGSYSGSKNAVSFSSARARHCRRVDLISGLCRSVICGTAARKPSHLLWASWPATFRCGRGGCSFLMT